MTDAMPHEEDVTGLWSAANRLLESPGFKRSPGLSKLLRYLVEMSVSGRAEALKSFTVAVDCLGRRADESAEAYARVQIARLRAALDTYYAKAGIPREGRLQLELGNYQLKLVPPGDGEIPEGAALPAARGGAFKLVHLFTRANAIRAILAVAVLAAVHFAYRGLEAKSERARWQMADFPVVAVDGSASPESTELSSLAAEITQRLGPYEGLARTQGNAAADFAIRLSVDHQLDRFHTGVELTEVGSGRVIWTKEYMLPDLSDASISHVSSQIAFHIGSATGVVHSYNRRRHVDSNSPYRCWLRFSELIETGTTIGDDKLFNCADRWYRNAAGHSLAAMLKGWTLADRSVVQVIEARRRALLEESLTVLYKAGAMDSESTGLQLAMMRTQALAGNGDEMRLAGKNALKLNPDSPHVQALVGLHLSLWNDPEGARLLNRAIAEHPLAPAWYYIGLCIDAMMHDDLTQEQSCLRKLAPIRKGRPLLAILFAAAAAHEGRVAEARNLLSDLPFRTMFGGIRIDQVLERLPCAPSVRGKFNEMLEPVTD